MPALAERENAALAIEGKKPFAFDLAREYDLIQRHGDSYYDFFIAQSHYYAKESYGKVPNVEYEHLIERDNEGNVKLRFKDPLATFAEESYAAPVFDSGLPVWYRKRAAADVRWTRAIQERLRDSLPGDTFIDLSPTEFEVSIEDRKKWGFGWHSFVRVHRLVVEDGQEKLVSRAVRNYLDFPEQQRLSEILSGGRLGLGDVGKLKEAMGIGHINKFIQDLWGQTSPERKINPPADQLVKSEQEINSDLRKLDFWLNRVFILMKNGEGEDLILREFRGWENAVRALVNGKDKNVLYLYSKSTQGMDFYMRQDYNPGANGCGFGSGFGEITIFGVKLGSNTGRVSTLMSYSNMTLNEGGKTLCCTCPYCGKQVEARISGGKISCPECSAQANWSETAAQVA